MYECVATATVAGGDWIFASHSVYFTDYRTQTRRHTHHLDAKFILLFIILFEWKTQALHVSIMGQQRSGLSSVLLLLPVLLLLAMAHVLQFDTGMPKTHYNKRYMHAFIWSITYVIIHHINKRICYDGRVCVCLLMCIKLKRFSMFVFDM